MGNKLPVYDMNNKTVIVTGANSGIGKATTIHLAQAGANVVMACRSKEKGQSALEEIKKEVPDAKLELMRVDLADFDSIISFCKEFKETHRELDVLINNAGIVTAKNSISKYGVEEMLTVNYLGTFLITHHLLDLIELTKGRVVSVTSVAHSFPGKLTLEKLNYVAPEDKIGTDMGLIDTMKQYGLTKLCVILFTQKLNSDLRGRSEFTRVYAVHPGWVETNIGSQDKGHLINGIESVFTKSAEEGAYPSVYCACDPDLTTQESGGYYDGVNHKGHLMYFASKDQEEDARTLWDWTTDKLKDYLHVSPIEPQVVSDKRKGYHSVDLASDQKSKGESRHDSSLVSLSRKK
jgi:retinol dehydrogenase-14